MQISAAPTSFDARCETVTRAKGEHFTAALLVQSQHKRPLPNVGLWPTTARPNREPSSRVSVHCGRARGRIQQHRCHERHRILERRMLTFIVRLRPGRSDQSPVIILCVDHHFPICRRASIHKDLRRPGFEHGPIRGPVRCPSVGDSGGGAGIAQQGVLSYRSLTGHASAYKLLYE